MGVLNFVADCISFVATGSAHAVPQQSKETAVQNTTSASLRTEIVTIVSELTRAKDREGGKVSMLVKCVKWSDQSVALACDGKCYKAWGINNRPSNQLSEDINDTEYLSDDELDVAPVDPGTYEGGCGKPIIHSHKLNKWCARECERSVTADYLGSFVELPDFSVRISNKRK